ncbi:MAG TPA: hypothetical protein VKF61_02015, partial [Candidatus Polarisedimenticolia bacterium]|nr:hypothetical protein [Candidatus Polarisedimenticolia bacterium]
MHRLVRLGTLSLAAYAAVVLAAAFIFGVDANLAGRDAGSTSGGPGLKQKGMTFDERFGSSSSYIFWQRTKLPHGQERIPGLSPFGDDFQTIPVPAERAGLVQTPLGFFDLKNPRWAERLPRGLTRAATRSRPGRGGLAPGANILQVSEQALRDLGADAVERELGKSGRLVAAVPDRAFVVSTRNAGDLDRLAALPFVEASTPYHPAFKIDRTLGRVPLIQASRARSTTLELMVAAWPGADHAELQALRREVEAIAGARAVSEYDGDATLLRVEAPAGQVTAIAALDSVAAVQEIPETMAANAEGPSLAMTGSVEDTLGA